MIADAYQAGLDKMIASGYEEFGEQIPDRVMVIKALRTFDSTAKLIEELIRRLNYDGHDIESLTLGDIFRAINGKPDVRSPAEKRLEDLPIRETSYSTEDMLSLAEKIDAARTAFLDNFGSYPGKEAAEKLSKLLWDDKGLWAPVLRELADRRSRSQPGMQRLLQYARDLQNNASGGDEVTVGMNATARAIGASIEKMLKECGHD